jgi:hypothetical protein
VDGAMIDAPYGVPSEAEGELVPTPPPEGEAPPEQNLEPLPSPESGEGPIVLPEITLAPASGDASRPNMPKSAGSATMESRFDWGGIGLEAPQNHEPGEVRQASAELDLAPTRPANRAASAVQWIEPNRSTAGGTIPTGNWKASVR